jgi:hypothetical protein
MFVHEQDVLKDHSVPPPLPLRLRVGRHVHLVFLVFLWLLVFGGGLVLFSTDLDEMGGALPQCQVLELTGYYCPGCGTTRALYAFSQFHVLEAFGYNPLTLPVVVFLLVVLCWHTATFLWGVAPLRLPSSSYFGYGVIILIVGFTVLRNLPWWPFTVLAP